MRRFIRVLIQLALCIASWGSSSPAAATTPEEAIDALVAKLKKTGTLVPLVEAVDWERVFESMPPEEREAQKITGPEALRQYYAARAAANGTDRLEILRKDILGTDGLASNDDQAKFLTVEQALREQQRTISSGLSEMLFSVVDVKRDQGTAVVKLQRYFRNQQSEITLDMRATGNTWVISYGAPFNPLAPPDSLEPIGPFPKPEQVLAVW